MKPLSVLMFAALAACSASPADPNIDSKIASNPEYQKIAESVRTSISANSNVPVEIKDIAMFTPKDGSEMSCTIAYSGRITSDEVGDFVFLGSRDPDGSWSSSLVGPPKKVLNATNCTLYAKRLNDAAK